MHPIDVTGDCQVLTVPRRFSGAQPGTAHTQFRVRSASGRHQWINCSGAAAEAAARLSPGQRVTIHLSGVTSVCTVKTRRFEEEPQRLWFADTVTPA